MNRRALLLGLLFWAIGTVGIRFGGQYLLRPDRMLVLYAISFVAMGLLVRSVCRDLGRGRDEWTRIALLLILPTLVLDAFSCIFFPAVFPNVAPAAAGLFGGWMLICCGGGVIGALVKVP